MKHRAPLRHPDLFDFAMPQTLRRDLRDGLCELCSTCLSPADLKAGHSTCERCRTQFPREIS